MEKHATCRFKIENIDSKSLYIHKYYLHLELRSRISPADINGIRKCFTAECDVWERRLAEKLPDCVIMYKDIGMEKRIDGETARQVLLAHIAYLDDRQAELTAEELQAAINLNAWLIEWEKRLLARCIQVSEAMERQIRSGDSWLTDYHIEVAVDFFVRDDDPFSYKNMPDSYENYEDCGTLCHSEMLFSRPISSFEAAKDDYYGIGDSLDHNDRRHFSDSPVDQVRHCLTFHELYDHLYVPMMHMGRIGRIFTDIVIQHQNGIDVDLKGEQVIAVQDTAEMRVDFVVS